MQRAEIFLGPICTGQGASTAVPLICACAGAAGAPGADGGGASEEAGRQMGDAVVAHEMPEPSIGLRQRVRSWTAAGGCWVRGIAAAAMQLRPQLRRDGGRSQQGWLEIEMKKTPRPDQVRPLQLKVSCLVRVRGS